MRSSLSALMLDGFMVAGRDGGISSCPVPQQREMSAISDFLFGRSLIVL
jgi:hypothetical protein